MIDVVTGKTGAGKSMYLCEELVGELLNGWRPCCTNLPIEIEPWVNKYGVPQCGLRDYLYRAVTKRFPQADDEDLVNMVVAMVGPKGAGGGGRLRILTSEESKWWYLHRIDRQGNFVDVPTHLEDGNTIADWDVIASTGPHKFQVDEAGLLQPAKDWEAKRASHEHYIAQNRKASDDTTFGAQYPKQVATVIRNQAVRWTSLVNHGLRKLWGMLQPNRISGEITYSMPTGGNREVPSTFTRPINLALGGCYDTHGGVGTARRPTEFQSERPKAIDWKWGIAALAVVLVILGVTPFILGKKVSDKMTSSIARGKAELRDGVDKGGKNYAQAQGADSSHPPGHDSRKPDQVDAVRGALPPEPRTAPPVPAAQPVTYQEADIYVTSIVQIGRWFRATLSDGTTVTETTPGLTEFSDEGIVWLGRRIRFHKTDYTAQIRNPPVVAIPHGEQAVFNRAPEPSPFVRKTMGNLTGVQ